MTVQERRVAIVGVGGLGGALSRGLLRAGLPPQHLTACDVDGHKLQDLAGAHPDVRWTADAREAAHGADVVVLCVKPASVAAALDRVADAVGQDAVVVSVAAGVTLANLRTWLGARGHLVRAMPNVNVAVARSMTALCGEDEGPAESLAAAEWLFGCVGTTVVLKDESSLDAATALAASGPAFMALVLEALMDGGVKAGLPRATARAMALGMVEGTARHIDERAIHPGELKDMVMSPGGTTAAGLCLLEERGARGALLSAVDAAARRARELGGK